MTFIQRDRTVTGYGWGAGTVVDGALLERCEIFGCPLDLPPDPRQRPVFRNVTMIDNIVSPMRFDGAIVEDTTIEGLRTLGSDDLLVIGGCVFRHVVLRGSFPAMNVVTRIGDSWGPAADKAYRRANEAYWENLLRERDWALDISEISGQVDLRGIPAALVLRDPETQMVMTFEQALSGVWRDVPGMASSVLRVKIGMLLESGWRDTVLATHPQWPGFAEDMRILRDLRRMGVVEPD